MPLFGRGRADGPIDLRLSTGFAAVDALLGGGVAPGAVCLLRSDGSARRTDFREVHLPLTLAAVAAGRGALVLVAPGEDPAALWADWTRRSRGVDLTARVRLADYGADHVPLGPWHVPLHPQLPARIAVPRMEHTEREVRGPEGLPFLEINCLDTIEATVGPYGAERMIATGLQRLPVSRNWAVYWGERDGPALAALRSRASVELTLHRDRAGLSVGGNRPSFPLVFLAP